MRLLPRSFISIYLPIPMGASLYIDSMSEPGLRSRLSRTRADAAITRTEFRDAYNATNVLWTCGLSWWSDVIPLLNDDLELAGESLVRFRNKVAGAEQRLPTAAEIAAY